MPCGPPPHDIKASPMAVELRARRRTSEGRLLVDKRAYIAANRAKRGGGEGEIRTLDGPVTHNGFRDRRLQPLGHLSSEVAVPTGFETAFSGLTGARGLAGYTPGP